MKDSREQIYEEMTVPKAVMKMAVPTIISQIISMVYNMADTFYIGQLGDPAQVAAVSIAAPAALLLTALANFWQNFSQAHTALWFTIFLKRK